MDADGQVIVTGGNDSNDTSIYTPSGQAWAAAAALVIPRGYHASVTIGDGRVFTIGGSWSGATGGKTGEIYSPTSKAWTLLPGADVRPMLTADAKGVYRADNHAWLFAYKANSVFQAGPSKAMNWYNVSGAEGSYTAAGVRAADGDAMCGTATMYDAVNGLILTAGGSPSYDDSYATTNAHIIRLGAVNARPTVTKVPNMAYARAFANAVVLPDGKVLVTGGQSYTVIFTDTNSSSPAELFDPATNKWTTMASIATPRTYHSIALLLPDATVVAGGGGLCGVDCLLQNHLDAQIFTPPYLFKSDGSLAARPVISAVSVTRVKPGASFQITTAAAAAAFSLVRYGTATHSVNTDQRRVPLTATSVSGTTYSFTLPSDPGVLVPGYWMVFALDSAGVPSVATTIQVLLA